MVVPTHHHTRSKVGKRRSHSALKLSSLIKCPQCGSFILPHRVCSFCGYYKGKEIVDVYKGLSKRERKKRKQQIENAKESKEG